MKNLYFLKFIVVVFFLMPFSEINAQEKQKFYIDTLDNKLDLSHYLYDLHGFLPIPSIITEPAIGYGGALAAVFFIPKKKDENSKKAFTMPDVVGAVGGYTESNTWFAGLGYFGFWNDDQIRYRGIAGYLDAKLSYYGNGNDFLQKNPLNFNLKGVMLLQQAIFRISDTDFLLGGNYHYFKSETIFFQESIIPEYNMVMNISGIGLIAEYENLDNYFSPTSGFRSNITYDQNLQALGGDHDFGRLTAYALHYLSLNEKWSSGLRFETQLSTGNVPFFAYPFISLRGVPAMRYQGDLTVLLETEQQFFVDKRWSLLAFGGYGETFNLKDELTRGSSAWNVGGGFRYLIARLIGLRAGIDIARGPEQWAFYITAGSAWMR